MKIEIRREGYRLLHPKMTFLLTSVDKKGKSNVMSLAWATPVSMEPFLVAIAVGKESLTAENIQKSKEFVLNIPSAKFIPAVWKCGTKSGREVDKFKLTKLTIEKGRKVKAPLIKECIGHIECKVIKKIDVNECFLFIGEVLSTTVDNKIFKKFFTDEAKVVLHLGGKHFAIPKYYG